MSRVLFISDLHFDHKNICKYRERFKTVEEHNEFIYESIMSSVTKNDVLWILGDICFSEESLEYIRNIKQKVKQLNICLGNHEDRAKYKVMDIADNVHGVCTKYNVWISHAPIHPNELRGKINFHGHCIHQDSEILTLEGWKGIDDISKEDKVYSYDASDGLLKLDNIEKVHKVSYTGKIYEFDGKGLHINVTEDHRVPSLTVKDSKYKVELANKAFSRSVIKFIKSGLYNNKGIDLSDNMLEMYIMLAADGNITESKLARLKFRKGRKKKKALDILHKANIEYTINVDKDNFTTINFKLPRELYDWNIKGLDFKLTKCNKRQASIIKDTYSWTDGNRDLIFTSKKQEVDILQHLFVINGYSCKTHYRDGHGYSDNRSYQLSVTRRQTQHCARVKDKVKSSEVTAATYWCITTSSYNNFLCRYKGSVHLTGNCHAESIRLENGELDERYVNLCCENVNYTPINLQDIKAGWRSYD